MKSKLMLIAYRAFGDWVYTVPILPFLFEKYDVHLECNTKVNSLAHDDPRFCGITVFDDTAFIKQSMMSKDFDPNKAMQEHLQGVYDQVLPDEVMNLSNSHENKSVASRGQEAFFYPMEERKKIFGKWNYYESVFDHVDIPMPPNLKLDEIYFTEKQEKIVKQWRDKHTSDFLVIIPLLGSCMQKFYPYMNEVITHIVDTYHNAFVYLLGESGITEGSFNHPRIYDMTGKLSMKQSILMTKYADYVIGPETGIVVAAGMWGTPKTMLCNTTAIQQTCSVHKNDHSLQSSALCSPCHRGIYTEEDCEDIRYENGIPYSGCVHGFKLDDIYGIINMAYEEKNIYNKEYLGRFVERAESRLGKRIYASRWGLIEKYCKGKNRLLDYGCSSGAFHKASCNGFTTDGYDVNPNSPYHAVPRGTVDILTMWDVIEHLHNPAEPIKKYNPKYIFITTPNLHKGVEFETWKHNRPKEHLQYFNEQNMTELLQGLSYEVKEVNYEEGAIRDSQKPFDIITFVAVKV